MKRKRWLREVVVILVVYAGYSLVRSLLGENSTLAEQNARRVVDFERTVGLLHERSIQQLLDHPFIIRPLNTYYALPHFFVTGGVILWLFLTKRGYPRRRNAIMATTCLALAGYALFPLMPPRLLPGFGVVDTLEVYGAPWTYSGSTVGSISNQFAAMPSLHAGWALWCTWAVWGETRNRWARTLVGGHSVLSMVAVVATGNHYPLDIVGGAVVLGAGIWLSGIVMSRSRRSEAVIAPVDGDHVAGVVAARTTREIDG